MTTHREKALLDRFEEMGLKMEIKKMTDVINGSISVPDMPNATHQSALRIRQKTSVEKFLSANPTFSTTQACKMWMKQLFVSAGDSSDATKLKAMYVSYMKTIAPEEPMDGFLRLDVVVNYPFLKKHKKNEDYEYIVKNTKPDIDNVVKIISDSMEKAGLVKNDSRFARIYMEKRYSHRPGVQFRISRMGSSKLRDLTAKNYAGTEQAKMFRLADVKDRIDQAKAELIALQSEEKNLLVAITKSTVTPADIPFA